MAEIEEQIDSITYKFVFLMFKFKTLIQVIYYLICVEISCLVCRVQIFQMNKCSACDTSLQLPAIHFLCKHSYHAHCLESYSEKADYCPACIRSNFDERFISIIIWFFSRKISRLFEKI